MFFKETLKFWQTFARQYMIKCTGPILPHMKFVRRRKWEGKKREEAKVGEDLSGVETES